MSNNTLGENQESEDWLTGGGETSNQNTAERLNYRWALSHSYIIHSDNTVGSFKL